MPVILVTNDLSMKINASACGALVEGYRNESIESSSNEQYSGKRFIDTVTDEDIDNLYAAGKEGVGVVSLQEPMTGRKRIFDHERIK